MEQSLDCRYICKLKDYLSNLVAIYIHEQKTNKNKNIIN